MSDAPGFLRHKNDSSNGGSPWVVKLESILSSTERSLDMLLEYLSAEVTCSCGLP